MTRFSNFGILGFTTCVNSTMHCAFNYLVDIEHGYDFNRKVCIKGQDLGDTTKGQSFNYISF